MTVFVEKVAAGSRLMVNGTGDDLDQNEFCINGPYAAIAEADIANAASGSFRVEGGVDVQSDDLVYGEDTFATLGAPVYWDDTGKAFSDTGTPGYYLVGYLVQVKTGGVIVFEKLRYAEVVAS